MTKKIDQRDIAWFGPIWRRIALVAVIGVWTAGEWLNGDQFWALMTTVVLGYAVWYLFINFPSTEQIATFKKAEAEKAADETADAGPERR